MAKRLVILSAKRERIRNILKRGTDCHSRLHGFAMTGKRKFIRTPYVFAITKRLVILSAKRERIRNILKRGTDCHGAKAPRNDRGVRIAARLAAVSPAGSVGASASQRCPSDTRTAMTNRGILYGVYLILSVLPSI